MLAQRMPGILPPLTRLESLETTRIYSALGLLPDGIALMDQRPVRTPHHSATAQALVGGGSIPRPGEVSLAHHGILFLDELPEFQRYVLEHAAPARSKAGDVTVDPRERLGEISSQVHARRCDESHGERIQERRQHERAISISPS